MLEQQRRNVDRQNWPEQDNGIARVHRPDELLAISGAAGGPSAAPTKMQLNRAALSRRHGAQLQYPERNVRDQ